MPAAVIASCWTSALNNDPANTAFRLKEDIGSRPTIASPTSRAAPHEVSAGSSTASVVNIMRLCSNVQMTEHPAAMPHGPIEEIEDGVFWVQGSIQFAPLMRLTPQHGDRAKW